MKKLSKHNALQHAWIDGAAIQIERIDYQADWDQIGNTYWVDDSNPSWDEESNYRIKPAEPEKVYPATSLSHAECIKEYNDSNATLVGVANAAIRRAIDDGQVFTKEQLKSISVGFAIQEVKMTTEDWENQRAQRDMAIAKAFVDYFGEILELNRAKSIIAGVK